MNFPLYGLDISVFGDVASLKVPNCLNPFKKGFAVRILVSLNCTERQAEQFHFLLIVPSEKRKQSYDSFIHYGNIL